jgi:hypothetical protein
MNVIPLLAAHRCRHATGMGRCVQVRPSPCLLPSGFSSLACPITLENAADPVETLLLTVRALLWAGPVPSQGIVLGACTITMCTVTAYLG